MSERDDDRDPPAHGAAPSHETSAQPEPNRRAFVALTVVGSTALAAAAAGPVGLMLADPLKRDAEPPPRFLVGKLADFEPGKPKRFVLVGDEVDAWTRAKDRKLGSIWLVRSGAREVRALSTICPHLGCGIEPTPDGKGFACPCHTSFFDPLGRVVSGPSPRAMDTLPVEVASNGDVFVTFKRFRIGSTTAEELA